MASTTFVDRRTPIMASWLNDVNAFVYANEIINVAQAPYNAVGDGVTDDYAAIQAALNAATGMVIIPPGSYIISSGLVFPQTKGVSLVGFGEARASANDYPVKLTFTHTGSAAIRLTKDGQALKNVVIESSGARASAALDTTSFGVLVEGDDSTNTTVANSLLENVFVAKHPSHGFVYSGANFMNRFNGLAVRDCKGHALYISDGTITSRTNKGRPGGFIGDHLRFYKNGGHDLVITPMPEANDAYRVTLTDADFGSREGSQPAITAGIKLSDSCAVCHGENFTFINLAFSSRVLGVPTYAGVDVAGRSHTYLNCRFIGVVGVAVTQLGSLGTTDGIHFLNPYITNDSTISPAVVIGTSVGTVTIDARNQTGTGVKQISSPFTTGYTKGLFIGPTVVRAVSFEGNGETTEAVKITRDSAVCGYGLERTGTGAATGSFKASGSTIQVGSTNGVDTVLIRNDTTRMTVKSNTFNFASLPTSTSGLTTGDIWNDSGTLKVV